MNIIIDTEKRTLELREPVSLEDFLLELSDIVSEDEWGDYTMVPSIQAPYYYGVPLGDGMKFTSSNSSGT